MSEFERLMAEGRAHGAAGRIAEARAAFSAADRLNPQSILPTAQLLWIAEQTGGGAEYEAFVRQALQRFPEAAFLWVRLSGFLLRAGEAAGAVAAAERAAATAREAAMVLHATKLLMDAGEAELARRRLTEAAQRFPAAPEIAWRQLDWREPPLAPLDDFAERQKIAEAHPGNGEVQFYFAERAGELGFFAEAAAALARLPVPGPPQTAARRTLRRAYLALHGWQLDEAIGRFSELLGEPHFETDALENLVRLLIMQGEPEAARQHLNAAFAKTGIKRRQLGLTSRPMHSFLGAILTEFQLRAADVDGLKEARRQAPRSILGFAGACAARRILATPVALMTAVMLREDGDFTEGSDGAARPGEMRFPQRIMQFWHDGEAPPDIAARMAGWQGLNRGWDYVRFDRGTALEFLAARFPPKIAAAFRAAQQPARQADLFRFAYLAAEGGVYADADSLCQAPVAPFMPKDAELFLYQETMGSLANDFIAAVPGQPLMAACVENVAAAILSPGWENTWSATGPGLLTRTAIARWAGPGGREELGRSVIASRWWMRRFMWPNQPASYKTRPGYWLTAEFGGGR